MLVLTALSKGRSRGKYVDINFDTKMNNNEVCKEVRVWWTLKYRVKLYILAISK